jgi:hypothetical protein
MAKGNNEADAYNEVMATAKETLRIARLNCHHVLDSKAVNVQGNAIEARCKICNGWTVWYPFDNSVELNYSH